MAAGLANIMIRIVKANVGGFNSFSKYPWVDLLKFDFQDGLTLIIQDAATVYSTLFATRFVLKHHVEALCCIVEKGLPFYPVNEEFNSKLRLEAQNLVNGLDFDVNSVWKLEPTMVPKWNCADAYY